MCNETVQVDFGTAIKWLKEGLKMQRRGWNGNNMFLVYVEGTKDLELKENTPYHKALCPDITGQARANINPHIDMYTAQDSFQPGWLASQSDMLADDWVVVT